MGAQSAALRVQSSARLLDRHQRVHAVAASIHGLLGSHLPQRLSEEQREARAYSAKGRESVKMHIVLRRRSGCSYLGSYNEEDALSSGLVKWVSQREGTPGPEPPQRSATVRRATKIDPMVALRHE
jgi:hypothetical protein